MDKPAPKRRRARTKQGKFKGDNPDTPANEAWEPIDLLRSVGEKLAGKYEVKPKVSSTSQDSSGKYSQKPRLRPTFGKVTTKFN